MKFQVFILGTMMMMSNVLFNKCLTRLITYHQHVEICWFLHKNVYKRNFDRCYKSWDFLSNKPLYIFIRHLLPIQLYGNNTNNPLFPSKWRFYIQCFLLQWLQLQWKDVGHSTFLLRSMMMILENLKMVMISERMMMILESPRRMIMILETMMP